MASGEGAEMGIRRVVLVAVGVVVVAVTFGLAAPAGAQEQYKFSSRALDATVMAEVGSQKRTAAGYCFVNEEPAEGAPRGICADSAVSEEEPPDRLTVLEGERLTIAFDEPEAPSEVLLRWGESDPVAVPPGRSVEVDAAGAGDTDLAVSLRWANGDDAGWRFDLHVKGRCHDGPVYYENGSSSYDTNGDGFCDVSLGKAQQFSREDPPVVPAVHLDPQPASTPTTVAESAEPRPRGDEAVTALAAPGEPEVAGVSFERVPAVAEVSPERGQSEGGKSSSVLPVLGLVVAIALLGTSAVLLRRRMG